MYVAPVLWEVVSVRERGGGVQEHEHGGIPDHDAGGGGPGHTRAEPQVQP